jgi:hypothetical protein
VLPSTSSVVSCTTWPRDDDHARSAANTKPASQPQPGFRGVHRPCAFNLASTICARANSCATAAAVSGNRFGSTIDGAAGQLILTLGGKPFGSTNSIAIVSWLTWAEARSVMGEDGDTADSSSVEGPFWSFHLRRARPSYPKRVTDAYT